MEFIREHRRIFIPGIVVLLLLFISWVYAHQEAKGDYIYHGIKIDNIDVSGLVKKDAVKKVKEEKAKEEHKIIFVEKAREDEVEDQNSHKEEKDSSKEFIIPFRDLGYSMDIEEAVDEAYDFGRKGSGLKKYWDIATAKIYHRNYGIEEKFDDKKIDKIIRYLADQVYIPPKDAYVTTDSKDKMVLYKEELGQYLDLPETKKLIQGNIEPDKVFVLPIYTKEPEIKSAYFDGINKLIGQFTTNFASSEKNRKSNIALGASFFNNKLIKPGETLSFNETVGDITEKRGFKTAGVIVNGEFDRGLGGGICQVSTTLYNAIVRADLEVVERYNHSRPIAYVPLGTDAAVVKDYKDLRFKNNTNHSIYIKAKADDKDITFKIFGNGEDRDYEVNIDPKLLGVIQPSVKTKYSNSMMEGQQKVEKSGAKGYSYRTYKEIVKKGKVVSREELSTSYYVPQNRVVIVGTREDKSSNDKNSSNSNSDD